MNNEILEYLTTAKEKFLSHVEKMKPSLYSKDRTEIEDFVIAYNQAVQQLQAEKERADRLEKELRHILFNLQPLKP